MVAELTASGTQTSSAAAGPTRWAPAAAASSSRPLAGGHWEWVPDPEPAERRLDLWRRCYRWLIGYARQKKQWWALGEHLKHIKAKISSANLEIDRELAERRRLADRR